MPDAPDLLAAELAAIEQRQEHGDLREFATADSPRLLAALEAVRPPSPAAGPLRPRTCP